MKISIGFVLCAVCTCSSLAWAQGAPTTPSFDWKDLLTSAGSPGVKLESISVSERERVRLSIVEISVGEALQQIALQTGARFVVAPTLMARPAVTLSVVAGSLDEAVDVLCRSQDIKKSELVPGATLFAPQPLLSVNRGLYQSQLRRDVRRQQNLRYARNNPDARLASRPNYNSDPFVIWAGPPKKVVPQPDWEKREFNGHEFYKIPLPLKERN